METKEIPLYGDLMTLESFTKCCKMGGFIDYDGYGYYSDGESMTNKVIIPSHVEKDQIDKSFSHVVWFNR